MIEGLWLALWDLILIALLPDLALLLLHAFALFGGLGWAVWWHRRYRRRHTRPWRRYQAAIRDNQDTFKEE